ncbi:hypothetical protein D0869_02315 [Hortaea werneckii]|uniref:Uncharacterized protein n=1 Tax=Hortaea werneckii TaxID=91943 RepID=A0A3M6XA02_HORWE|nr:hypothetical protein D0869_02315 [Hortaea werneckii]
MVECSLDVDFEVQEQGQIEGLRPFERQSDKPVVSFHGNVAQPDKMLTIEEMALEEGDGAVQGPNDTQVGWGRSEKCTAPLT